MRWPFASSSSEIFRAYVLMGTRPPAAAFGFSRERRDVPSTPLRSFSKTHSHVAAAKAVSLAGGVLAALVTRQPLFILLPAAVFVVARIARASETARRRQNFERDYPPFLLSLASAVRTGLDPLTALLSSGRLFDAGSELRIAVEAVQGMLDAGATEEQAISGFGSRTNHPDTGLFTTAVILARKEGSSLGDCLERLAKVTRQRESFRRKTKAAVAMQKLSAIGIAVSAVVIGAIQAATNLGALRSAFAHPAGSRILGAGMLLIVGGLIWMMSMTKGRF